MLSQKLITAVVRADPVPSGIYQLELALRGSEPRIWRRILVPVEFSLGHLHTVLQIAMGWNRAHLYEFVIGPAHYADKHSTHMKLGNVAAAGVCFTYRYDFGDDWEHDVTVERVLSAEAGVLYPVCVAGDGDCPPEDCGGVERYVRLLAGPTPPTSIEPRGTQGHAVATESVPFCLEDVNQALWRWIAESRPRRSS